MEREIQPAKAHEPITVNINEWFERRPELAEEVAEDLKTLKRLANLEQSPRECASCGKVELHEIGDYICAHCRGGDA